MTNPEVEYQRLTSGDAAAIRAHVDTLASVVKTLDGVRSDLAEAATVPVWTGPAAIAFHARLNGLVRGVALTSVMVARSRGALDTAASAYAAAESDADYYIGFWRNRPATLHPVVEELFARVVNARLLSVGTSYNEQLNGIDAVLTGDEVDLDELDDETREWVEKGLAKNEDWMEGNDSGLGPLIPHTQATGDDRGLIPQGLGYDPQSGLLLQGYYDKGDGDPSTMALIDEVTGQPVGEVTLGGTVTDGDETRDYGTPGHAGGVAVDGDTVYVTDNGKVYTYSLSEMRNASQGQEVNPSSVNEDLSGGSYSAVKDGRLYLGDFENDQMYVYEKDSSGKWVEVDVVETPTNAQGVVVRDGEYVFSTSHGRDQESSLVVQDRYTDERGEPYTLPNMSQGVVEVNGHLLTSFESGAAEFDHPTKGTLGWLWGVSDDDGLWANPYMTSTPLGDLGLSGEFEVEPPTLNRAARDLEDAVSTLATAASVLDGLHVPAHILGEVPAAAQVSGSVTTLVGKAADSLRTGSTAVGYTADMLVALGANYTATDEQVGARFHRPGLS